RKIRKISPPGLVNKPNWTYYNSVIADGTTALCQPGQARVSYRGVAGRTRPPERFRGDKQGGPAGCYQHPTGPESPPDVTRRKPMSETTTARAPRQRKKPQRFC